MINFCQSLNAQLRQLDSRVWLIRVHARKLRDRIVFITIDGNR